MANDTKQDVERERISGKVVCGIDYYDRSKNKSSNRLALVDLTTAESKVFFERPQDGHAIWQVKAYDGENVLFSVGGEKIFKVNINTGKPEEILSGLKSVSFTRPYNGYFAYAIGGDLYLFNLNSQEKTLIATTDKPIGCVTSNRNNLIFTNVLDNSDGFSFGTGYEEEKNTQLELLVNLCLDGKSIKQIKKIEEVRKVHVSSMAVNNRGDLSFVRDDVYLRGAISYVPRAPLRDDAPPRIWDIDYLNEDNLAIAGRFVKDTNSRECWTKYFSGIKVLDKEGKVVYEIETDGGPCSISVVRENLEGGSE